MGNRTFTRLGSLQRTLGVALLFCALLSCRATMIPLELKVKAKDQHKQKLVDVQIFANGKLIGSTDSKGRWHGTYLAHLGGDLQLRLSKQSSEFYYGSYENRLRVSPSMKRQVVVDAKLSAIRRSADLSQVIANENTKPETVETQNITESPIEKTKALLSAYIYDVFKARAIEQPPLNIPKSEAGFLTIYTFSGQRQLAGTEVRVHPDSGDVLSCISNAQGRCVLPWNESFSRSDVRIVARRNGMQTLLQSMSIPKEPLLQLDLNFGQSIDIRAVEDRNGRPVGLSRVPVYLNTNKIGETDSFGYFSFPSSTEGMGVQELTLERDDLLPKRRAIGAVLSNGWNVLRFATRDLTPTSVYVRPVEVFRNNLTQLSREKEVAEDLVGAIALGMMNSQSISTVDENLAQFIIEPVLAIGDAINATITIKNRDAKVVANLTVPWQAKDGLTARAANAEPLLALLRAIEFDAPIADIMNDEFVVDIPANFNSRVKVGDQIDIFSLHNPQLRVSSAAIAEVWQDLVKLKKVSGSASIGDLVRFNQAKGVMESTVRLSSVHEVLLESIPSGASVLVGESDQPITTPATIKIDSSATDMPLSLSLSGYHPKNLKLSAKEIRQPGGAKVLVKLDINRVEAALALMQTSVDLAKAEEILAQSSRDEPDYFVSRIVLAGLYGEHLNQPHKGILELDRLIEQAGILNLNESQLFITELNRGILQFNQVDLLLTENPAAAKSLLREAQEALSRLSSRKMGEANSLQIMHSLGFYRTLIAKTLSSLEPNEVNSESARNILSEYEQKFASEPNYSEFVVTARGYRIGQPVAAGERVDSVIR